MIKLCNAKPDTVLLQKIIYSPLGDLNHVGEQQPERQITLLVTTGILRVAIVSVSVTLSKRGLHSSALAVWHETPAKKAGQALRCMPGYLQALKAMKGDSSRTKIPWLCLKLLEEKLQG